MYSENFVIGERVSTYDIGYHVEYLNQKLSTSTEIKKDLIEYSIFLAALNVGYLSAVDEIEGGPFGAVIYDPISKKVVSVGANHVVPENDPTAHAEIVAARNALKFKDSLEGLEVYTSCECCPMCLSYLLAHGVDKIYYSATRKDAASVGFSDEKQYAMLKKGYESSCTEDLDKNFKGCKVSVDHNQKLFEFTEETITVSALKSCCAKNASFHLPENTVFELEKKPHPYSLVALDWARVGRIRDKLNAFDPEKDADEKDGSKIIYHDDEYEKFGLNNVDEIIDAIKNGSSKISEIASVYSYLPFKIWKEFLNKANIKNAKKY